MNKDLIVFTDHYTVIYYDGNKLEEVDVCDYVYDLKKANKIIIYDSDIDEYFLDNKRIVFTEKQKNDLKKSDPNYLNNIYSLIRVYDREKRYLEIKQRGKFNNLDEESFYNAYVCKCLYKNKIDEIYDDERFMNKFALFLLLVLIVIGFFVYPNLSIVLGGIGAIIYNRIIYNIRAKEQIKMLKSFTKESKEEIEARENYRKYKENQLSKTNEETKIDFESILVDGLKSIEEESKFLNSEDRFEIIKKSNDILKDYTQRMKELKKDILTLDSEIKIQLDLSERMKELFNELEQMKKIHAIVQREELNNLLNQPREKATVKILK